MKTVISFIATCVVLSVLVWIGCSSDSGVTDPGGGNGSGDIDTLTPVVNITSPADDSALPSSLDITGTATDDTEVDTVFFEARDLCGQALWSGHGLAPPYEATWDASGAQDGGYRICMAAVDTAGNMSNWTCVNVTRGTASAQLDGFWPKGVYSGRRMTIKGSGFGTYNSSSRVNVDHIEATVEEWSDTAVTFVMPFGIAEDALSRLELIIDCRWRVAGHVDILPQGVIRLTDDHSQKEYPCWNSNGSEIYFCSSRSGNWDIWVMSINGGEWEQVTHDPEQDFMPDIKPSTGEMAWMSRRGVENNYDIYHGFLRSVEGGAVWEAPITSDNDLNRAPSYANQVYQGYSLVYGQFYDPDDDGSTIPTVFLYGSTAGHVELTEGDNPAFSYNGRWVVYQNNDYEICKIEVGGSSEPTVLTTGFGDFNPHWGWNNDKIVFHRNGINGYIGLCVMNSDGTGFETILDQRWDQKDPAWSPDCTKIVFRGHRWSNFDIYVYEVP